VKGRKGLKMKIEILNNARMAVLEYNSWAVELEEEVVGLIEIWKELSGGLSDNLICHIGQIRDISYALEPSGLNFHYGEYDYDSSKVSNMDFTLEEFRLLKGKISHAIELLPAVLLAGRSTFAL
jgi:hypothetical protein